MGNNSLRSSPGHSTWVLELLVPLLELNRFGILLGELEEGHVVSSVIGGILSIEARDMDINFLSAPESNNTLARCWFRRNVPMTTFGSWHDKLLTLAAGCFQWLAFCFCSSWSNEHLVASHSARSCVMQVVIVVVTVVWVAVVVGEGSSIIKLSFVIIGSLHRIVLCYLIH
ncbi:hypothetical protein Tco_0609942 [Tanacetum coccineum]